MAIYNLDLLVFKQNFNTSQADKLEYGEIITPFALINQMLDLFDPQVFSDSRKRWLDVGAGQGYFSIAIFDRLNQGLAAELPDAKVRQAHIVQQMLYLIELKESNCAALKTMFGANANILSGDFCTYSLPHSEFDFIIGNPPYNAHGLKKVPTNVKVQKKQDGQTIWPAMLRRALTLLKPLTGQLCMIVPSLWLKTDKAGMHQALTQYKIEKMHCFTNNETNKLFQGHAQTPTCYFLLTKVQVQVPVPATAMNCITLYDKNRATYVPFSHSIGQPLPLFGAHILQKIRPFIELAGGSLAVLKSNMPPAASKFTDSPYQGALYCNITTCVLEGLQPVLLLNYSTTPQAFHGQKKLVLAHKMYGFPYFDKTGLYGIANRDNYIILNKTDAEYEQLKAFLSTKLALYIFEAARYRMKYLERYAFQFMPDITRLPGFPAASDLNDQTVAAFFGLDHLDRQHINQLHKKMYKTFI
jgi:tRNA1(Val) A37 N6-methylase TrmN6